MTKVDKNNEGFGHERPYEGGPDNTGLLELLVADS